MKFLSKNVKISEVDIGDFVLACNIKTQTDVYRSVLNTMRPVVESDDQVEIVAENGATLVTSTTHPTAINDGSEIKYVKGGDITTDDYVVSIQNKKIKVRTVNKPNVSTQYADFSIDEHENYYAGRDPNNLLLAHNSATLYYPIWHLEVEDLLVLKNNKGTEDNRIRHMDYGVQFNKLMYERLLSGGNITLFSPSDVPGLYDAFFADTDRFTELYEAAEANPAIRKKTIKAADLFSQFAQERKDTGRIYLQNVDHANSHSPFKSDIAPIRQSNLCLTGDAILEIQWPDGREEHINLQSFVERWELGGMYDVKVKSHDIESNQTVWCGVSAAAQTATVTELIEIQDEAGRIIKCTPDHQILTKNRGYMMAKDLLETDELCAEIGRNHYAKNYQNSGV